MRPTGPLHLGHLVGAVWNWLVLQETHDCYFAIVDWHALTTDYADPSKVREYIREVAIDWLAAGIDPAKATLFDGNNETEYMGAAYVLINDLDRFSMFKGRHLNSHMPSLETYKRMLEVYLPIRRSGSFGQLNAEQIIQILNG
jgi:tryptophanyl-tRNA synthetase